MAESERAVIWRGIQAVQRHMTIHNADEREAAFAILALVNQALCDLNRLADAAADLAQSYRERHP